MNGGEQVLGAGGHPPDGSAELAGERGSDDLLTVDRPLHAEPAADIRRDDAQLVLGESEHRRDVGARQEGILGRQPQGQLVAAAVVVRSTPRGSIGAPARRLWSRRTFTMCAARENARPRRRP